VPGGGAEGLPAGWPDDPEMTFDPGATAAQPLPGVRPGEGLYGVELATWQVDESVAQGLKGSRHPHFRLVRLAGEGGFGEVWEAVQLSLGRTVALKRPPRSRSQGPMLTPSESLPADLFRQEALITARIEHPNVPPVYDLGLDADGQPVLAMRFARGRSWLDLLRDDRHSMELPDYLAKHLRIFTSVLHAVSYAHSCGIVHRDLKPSQVVVGEYGEVFVIDWGLAIRWGDVSPSEPAHRATWTGVPDIHSATSPAGTLAYMAPEQTEHTASRIGPWTDIYLLGGILYFILTGSPPHPSGSSSQAYHLAVEGSVRPIREAAPGVDLPVELTDLTMRCLSPAVSDRPPSAPAVLQSLEDYLAGTGRRRESAAIVESVRQRLQQAAGNYQEYGDLLAEILRAQTLWSGNPAAPALMEQVRSEFAHAALRNGDLVLARVQADGLEDENARTGLLAKISESESRLLRERRQRRVALWAAGALAIGLVVSAAFYTRALVQARNRAEAAHRNEAQARARSENLMNFMLRDLRESLEPVGRLDVLDKVARKALEEIEQTPEARLSDEELSQRAQALDQIGDVFRARGDIDVASRTYERSHGIRKRLAQKDPERPEWRRGLAVSLMRRGDVLEERGDTAGGMRCFEEAERILAPLTADPAAPADWLAERSGALMKMGDNWESQGNPSQALRFQRHAVTQMEECARREPRRAVWKQDLAAAHSKIGDLLSATGQNEEALAEYRRYLQIISDLLAKDPLNASLIRELAVAHNSVGWALRGLGKYDAALAEILEQQRLGERLVALDRSNANWKRDLAQSHAAAARILKMMGRMEEALVEYQAATKGLQELAASDPDNKSVARDASLSAAMTGSVLLALSRTGEAKGILSDAVGTLTRLAGEDPSNAMWQYGLASAEIWLGQAEERLGDQTSAVTRWSAAVKQMEPFTSDPAQLDQRLGSARAMALLLLGRVKEAKPFVDSLLASGWSDPEFLETARKAGFRVP